MKRPGAKAVSLLLSLGLIWGTVTLAVAAPKPLSNRPGSLPARHSQISSRASSLPHPVSFRTSRDHGLLVKVWVNNSGPYTFAIDTGAGITLIGGHVATSAATQRLSTQVDLGGLSGVSQSKGRMTIIGTLAIGDQANTVHANQRAIVTDNLPAEIDGVLDPTAAYSPFGYSIDLPGHEIAAFDPRSNPLSTRDLPEGGAVVPWVAGSNRRPFVRLGDGRLALLDTGSGFGLAISHNMQAMDKRRGGVRDLGGGEVTSRRVDPSTISIGSLTLRDVPTDLLTGVEKDAPLLLGRDALYPFRLTFDPVQRLIEIAPVVP